MKDLDNNQIKHKLKVTEVLACFCRKTHHVPYKIRKRMNKFSEKMYMTENYEKE